MVEVIRRKPERDSVSHENLNMEASDLTREPCRDNAAIRDFDGELACGERLRYHTVYLD